MRDNKDLVVLESRMLSKGFREWKKHLVVVLPSFRSRGMVGKIDLSGFLKSKLYSDLSEAEKVAGYKDREKAEMKLKTFLPENYYRELTLLKKKPNEILRTYEIAEGRNLMLKKDLKNFEKELKEAARSIQEKVNEIADNWDYVLSNANRMFRNVAPGLTEEEYGAMMKAIPSKESFVESYRQPVYFETMMISKPTVKDVVNGEKITGEEALIDNFKQVIVGVMTKTLDGLDRLFEAINNGDVSSRTRSAVNKLPGVISNRLGVFENDNINAIGKKIEELRGWYNAPALLKNKAMDIYVDIWEMMKRYDLREEIKECFKAYDDSTLEGLAEVRK